MTEKDIAQLNQRPLFRSFSSDGGALRDEVSSVVDILVARLMTRNHLPKTEAIGAVFSALELHIQTYKQRNPHVFQGRVR